MSAIERMRRIVSRAKIKRISDSGGVQRAQVSVLAGELMDDVPRLQDFGLSSVPLAGADAIVLAVGGSRNNLVVIKTDDVINRPKGLQPGETAYYNAHGIKLLFARQGVATLTAKKLIIKVDEIEFHANKSMLWDVHGYGEKWEWLAGSQWKHTTYQTGAVVTEVPKAIMPPEIAE